MLLFHMAIFLLTALVYKMFTHVKKISNNDTCRLPEERSCNFVLFSFSVLQSTPSSLTLLVNALNR